MSSHNALASRSWGGCTRCRKRRQKCDEEKPDCRRCQLASAVCEYRKPLRWGGRSFGNSGFGKYCQNNGKRGVEKLKSNDGSFVYTLPRTWKAAYSSSQMMKSTPMPSCPETGLISIYQDGGTGFHRELGAGRTIEIPSQLAQFPMLTAYERQLLDHFINRASRTTSCHRLVHHSVCSMILPMATESPALLSATLLLSAIHSKSLGSSHIEHSIVRLKTQSLKLLRSSLQQPQSKSSNDLLATIRTLCLAEVYDDGNQMDSWRAHYNGARALMGHVAQDRIAYADPAGDLLRRWFLVTEGLIAMTPGSIVPETIRLCEKSEIEVESVTSCLASNVHGSATANVYIDEYTGCATDVSKIFREIGLAIKIHANNHIPLLDGICTNYKCGVKAGKLKRQVQAMLTRDQIGLALFLPQTVSQLSWKQVVEFSFCNRAYQYAALLQIQRRLFDMPSSHSEVQKTVGKILGCVERISPADGLSPIAVLATPIFMAGCEAFGNDRTRVRRIFEAMFAYLHIPNLRRALKLLEEYWVSTIDESWFSWAEFAKANKYDFLPY